MTRVPLVIVSKDIEQYFIISLIIFCSTIWTETNKKKRNAAARAV